MSNKIITLAKQWPDVIAGTIITTLIGILITDAWEWFMENISFNTQGVVIAWTIFWFGLAVPVVSSIFLWRWKKEHNWQKRVAEIRKEKMPFFARPDHCPNCGNVDFPFDPEETRELQCLADPKRPHNFFIFPYGAELTTVLRYASDGRGAPITMPPFEVKTIPIKNGMRTRWKCPRPTCQKAFDIYRSARGHDFVDAQKRFGI